jgi:hypothetical protein
MTDGHCFISYSVADGLNFVTQLSTDLEAGLPFIKTWFDKRDLESGENWDDQLASAIRGCKCLMFVMTEDSTLHGIIVLRQGHEVAARGAFLRAIGQADEILAKTAEYYEALDAKGLAWCGLALCDSVGATRRVALTDAVETFRMARKIAPHAGVVKSVLRLFDELVKCEGGEILKDVREVIAG